jgi:hypothetical protein
VPQPAIVINDGPVPATAADAGGAGADAAELHRLRARVDAGGTDALRAAPALLEGSIRAHELTADAGRLLALARRPSTGPELAGLLAARVAEAQAIALIQDALRCGTEPDPGLVRPITETAEFAYRRAPQRVQARTSVALARLLADRPAEARNFLVGLNAAAADVRSRVNVAAVRAFAEIELGDLAQARRLVDRAARLDPAAGLLPLARLAVEQAERGDRQS